MLACGLLCAAAGVGLIIRWYVARPPDPKKGNVDQVIAFVLSNRFAAMSPERRQQFIEDFWTRWSEFNAEQQAKLMKVWSKARKKNTAASFGLASIVMRALADQADAYAKVPPDQRRAWLQHESFHVSESGSGAQPGGAAGNTPTLNIQEFLQASSPMERAHIVNFLRDEQRYAP